MKDEIKDLKCLGALGNLQSFAIDGTKGSKIVDINVNIVKDYITKLQEENKRLKEINKEQANHLISKDNLSYEDYKSRNEKAIEYLREIEMFEKKFGFDGVRRKKLLNILQGSNKE